ncbi:uncharacterized protein BX664DRAFT_156829 [Halteromyces radiatus]|uniref:uncharacterized protein n=1 Tax=Halteromyces radiatus TaxID=101107 RepID=UPI00221FBF49|nr:uncharacterized protein BX664DRAFT_156829 [Halteromyces radiatus]KAI8086395.1 hypothetical protein BX664DRAFT_156829 [Halteromyces radiatus]
MKSDQKKSRRRPDLNSQLDATGQATHSNTAALINQLMEQTYPPTRCPCCHHQGNTRTETEAHYRQHHKGESGYVCMDKTCVQRYSSRPGLQYHLRASHSFSKSKDK